MYPRYCSFRHVVARKFAPMMRKDSPAVMLYLMAPVEVPLQLIQRMSMALPLVRSKARSSLPDAIRRQTDIGEQGRIAPGN